MNDTCPVCGNQLYDIGNLAYENDETSKLIYRSKWIGKQCFECGWKSDKPEEKNRLADELSEYFIIPCDLCNKYFQKDGSCPEEIEKCSNERHWGILLERICKDD